MSYDYIIVGAGSAGCILANRLSESGRHSVLLLEAGERDASFWFKVPVGFTKTYYNRRYNWMYYSEPEAQLAELLMNFFLDGPGAVADAIVPLARHEIARRRFIAEVESIVASV